MHTAVRSRRWYDRLPPPLRGRPLTLLRRAFAAALFVLAAVLAVRPGGGEPSAPMLVSARDLPLGTTLGPSDVRVVQVPESVRPAGVLTGPAAAQGRVLAGLARAGEPITDVRLVGARSTPPGTATVPVRLADPGVTGLLRPGTRVDVVALGDSGRADGVLAIGATVLAVLGEQARDGPGGEGPLVLVAAPQETASELAAATLGREVTVTLRS
ncbi:Flp pilus assembly protein CpaB [Prauserella shujinwangii]|uniref:Flp pilus assembly protein CpaB n=1 Tax=Prauserella shujinwangii TaxID=1453103 RepID=A0A2T0M0D4_9PSEU|nr:SAF domain-containing protein [Prauserella shujinwangii]PRX50049.1 Flp pilus assembly protein CpaB [Prauserella shujinwangii]